MINPSVFSHNNCLKHTADSPVYIFSPLGGNVSLQDDKRTQRTRIVQFSAIFCKVSKKKTLKKKARLAVRDVKVCSAVRSQWG